MKLITNGTQEFLGTEIPVIEGGFGEEHRCILAKDVARIHEMEVYRVNELIKNNLYEFETGIDILEIFDIVSKDNKISSELGVSRKSLNRSENIYLLSESGYMTLCMLMRTDKSREIRRQFRKEYFAMRAQLASQAEYIKILENHKYLIENNENLTAECAKLTEKNKELYERLTTACAIPMKQLKKDVRVFISEYTKPAVFGRVYKDEMFGVYLWSRKTRREQPTRVQFEDVMSELGYIGDIDSWTDIVWS